jgi:hypothetical protein
MTFSDGVDGDAMSIQNRKANLEALYVRASTQRLNKLMRGFGE